MRSAQIVAIDLADAVGLAEQLFADREISVHPVDDFDEAGEIAGVVGADLVLLSPAAAGQDPILRLGSLGERFGGRPPPFAAIDPKAFERTRIYLKLQAGLDWVTVSPGGERLAPLLAALLDKGDAVVHVEIPAIAAVRSRLIDIGFNTLIKADTGDVSVQTETHVIGQKAVVRSIAFTSGRIALSRRFPLGFVANPVDETRRLAEEIHRETCETMAGRKAVQG